MCLVRMCQLQSLPRFFFGGLRSRQKLSPEVAFVWFFEQKTNKKHNRDEYFGGKRNAASGTLWKDTN